MPFHILGVPGELPCPRLGACAFLSPSMAVSCRDSLERMGGLAWASPRPDLPHIPTCTGQAELHSSMQWEAQLRCNRVGG